MPFPFFPSLPSLLPRSGAGLPIAAATVCGRVHSDSGKASQDRFGINASLSSGYIAVCVCDGHGPNGGTVAEVAAHEMMATAERVALPPDGLPCGEVVRVAISSAASAVEKLEVAQNSGTTCAVALIAAEEGRLAVASVGDCEAMLVKRGVRRNSHEVEVMSAVHRTYDPIERTRVEQAGGVVQAGYVIVTREEEVNSGEGKAGERYTKSLNITRSLGDLDMRAHGIISEPSVTVTDIPHADSCLILGTDGLLGNVDDDEIPVTEWFGEAVAKHVNSPGTVVKRLFGMAGKTSDDATVVAVRLRDAL